MKTYNINGTYVYKTYQCYRKVGLDVIKHDFEIKIIIIIIQVLNQLESIL